MEESLGHNINGRYNPGKMFQPQYQNNTYVLPPGMILACTPQLPNTSIDTTGLERILSSKIYQTFGIPEALVGAAPITSSNKMGSGTSRNSSTRNSVNVMDVVAFEAVLDRYRRFFTDAFLIVYEEIYKKSIPRETISFNSPDIYTKYLKTLQEDSKNEVKTKKVNGDEDEKTKNDNGYEDVKTIKTNKVNGDEDDKTDEDVKTNVDQKRKSEKVDENLINKRKKKET